MSGSLRRILAMLTRYLYLHKRSLPRMFELFFWPVMELFVWGFVTVYLQEIVENPASRTMVFLINAMIFWDILYRSQQAVTISIMEEVWHQNILNILVSPLRIWEWMTATFLYGLLKTTVITAILMAIALFCYRFNLATELGFYLFPLAGNLLLYGWVLGIFTSGLLLRFGYSAEALIWGIPYLIQPLSAAFYPLSVLPDWLQIVARVFPSTYVFEGMRTVLKEGAVGWAPFTAALLLNVVFFVLAAAFFRWMYACARESGRLVRFGMD